MLGRRNRVTRKVSFTGEIICIHHDWTDKIGNQLFNPPIPHSVIDVQFGRRHCYNIRIIRPMKKRFALKGKGEVKSGDKMRITMEVIK